MRKLFCVFFAGVLCLGLHCAVQAQIAIDQKEVKLVIKPGETKKGIVSVFNDSEKSLTVKAYFEDLVFPSPFDNRREFRPLGSTPYSCGAWIELTPASFVLTPHSKQEVGYTIRVPENIKSGGYYGMLYFEKGSEGTIRGTGLNVVFRFGCSFILETPDREKKGAVEKLRVEGMNIKGSLKNTGNAVMFAEGTYSLIDSGEIVRQRGNAGSFSLPPDETVPFEISNLAVNSFTGQAFLVLTFDLGEGDFLVQEIALTKDDQGGLNISSVKD